MALAFKIKSIYFMWQMLLKKVGGHDCWALCKYIRKRQILFLLLFLMEVSLNIILVDF